MIKVKLTNSYVERFDIAGAPGLWVFLNKHAVENWQELVDGLEHKTIGSQAIRVRASGTVKLEVEKKA